MKLILNEQESRLRANWNAGCADPEDDHDPVPVVKLFTPWAGATWLLTELTPDGIGFGLCDLGHGTPELGYVSLAEVESVRGPGGLTIERDRHFNSDGVPLSVWTEAARSAGHIPYRTPERKETT